MKKIKVSILALSVLVGGAVFASAAEKAIVVSTANIVVTNIAPLVWVDVNDFPTSVFLNTTNLNEDSVGWVDTDSKGKIYGVFNLIKDWTKVEGSNTVLYAQSSWIGTASGSVKASKMGQPTIQMTMKANGYTSPTTNTLIINKQNSSGGNASMNVNFKSTSAPVAVNTNDNTWKVVGTSKINFKPGITLVQTSKTITEAADLKVRKYSEKELPMRIVSYGTKFGVLMQDLFGTGSANSKGGFSVNLKEGSGGSTLNLKGQLAAATIINSSGTNQVITFSQVDEKGKIQGQAVEGKGIFSSFTDWYWGGMD
jgi:hypothetical protein